MKKTQRKICICLTPRQIIGSILLAVSAVNLIIVGAAFEVAFPDPVPTNTATMPLLSATVTAWTPPTATEAPTEAMPPPGTSTPTAISSLTPTNTATITHTPTFLPSPVPTQCIPRSSWPIYMIQRGDTLSSLAIMTGSSIQELMLANCLADTRIFAGQLLHVPRLPILPTTAAPLVIPSDTPSPPKNSPSIFKPDIMTCDGSAYVSLSAVIYDNEGVVWAVVKLYTTKGEAITKIEMTPNGELYYGSGFLPKPFTVNDVGYYIFSTVDSLQAVTDSQPYSERAENCIPFPTDTPPVSPG